VDAAGVAESFGLGRGARLSDGPAARGKQGLIWRLDTHDGAFAVKTSFDGVDEAAAELTTRFSEAAFAAGVPTPEVVRTVDGAVFATVGDDVVRVHRWVELGGPDPLIDPELVGHTVGAIHALARPTAGSPDPWHVAPVGEGAWVQLVARLRAGGAPFADRLADIVDDLVELESWLTAPERVEMCHCDLWADNVVPTPDGAVCVIDWDNSGPAGSSHELGLVAFEFARTDPGRLRALLAAYRDAGGTGALTSPGDFTMVIAQLGHITQMASQDWLLPNDRSPDRRTAQAWVSEVFDDPHTPDSLARMLRWAS